MKKLTEKKFGRKFSLGKAIVILSILCVFFAIVGAILSATSKSQLCIHSGIRGRVIDTDSKVPLAGVPVKQSDTGIITFTNEVGEFFLKPVFEKRRFTFFGGEVFYTYIEFSDPDFEQLTFGYAHGLGEAAGGNPPIRDIEIELRRVGSKNSSEGR